MTNELYDGQTAVVAAKLAEDEMRQQADRELLEATTDTDARQVIMRRIAGREGSLATRRRFLAQLRGDTDDAVRGKVLRFRLTDTEYADLQQRAEEAGQTVSQYLRSKVF